MTVVRSTLRGVVGSMAMTGMRKVTENLGLIEETPPKAIFRQKTKKQARPLERAALAADHALFGAVLSAR